MRRLANAGLSAAELRALPLAPVEGFVLSRVEAESSEEDLELATGLDPTTLGRAIERLLDFGVLREVGSRAPASAGLSADERAKVGELEARMRSGDLYAMLGVAPEAERRAIKDAYFELVAFLHPDAFRDRDLRDDAARLTTLFEAVERAHSVLSHRERRATYDEERRARTAERDHPVPLVSGRAPIALGLNHIVEDPPSGERTSGLSAATGQVLARKLGRAPAPAPGSSGRLLDPPSDRRPAEAIAGHEGLGSGPVSEPGVQTPPRSDATVHAMAELRRRYERLAPLARAEKLASLLEQGNSLLAAGSGREALQSFRLAQAIAPDDLRVLRGIAEAEALAAPEIAKSYQYFARRAEYSEQGTDARAFWEEAAQRAPDDAETQARAAEAMLRLDAARGLAVRFAGRAVLLEPKRADFHVLLGRAYLAQGMLRQAERAAQSAETLDPLSSEVKELQRELALRVRSTEG